MVGQKSSLMRGFLCSSPPPEVVEWTRTRWCDRRRSRPEIQSQTISFFLFFTKTRIVTHKHAFWGKIKQSYSIGQAHDKLLPPYDRLQPVRVRLGAVGGQFRSNLELQLAQLRQKSAFVEGKMFSASAQVSEATRDIIER